MPEPEAPKAETSKTPKPAQLYANFVRGLPTTADVGATIVQQGLALQERLSHVKFAEKKEYYLAKLKELEVVAGAYRALNGGE